MKKTQTLAEEIGHYKTTVGDITDQSNIINRKQEQQARLWGYNRLIGLHGLIQAYEHKCKDIFEVADYLNVTVDYLAEAIIAYKKKYGMFTTIDNYIIYFEPAIVIAKML